MEVTTEVGMSEGVLSGGNRWTVLLLLKLGNGLVDKTKESFRSGEVGRWQADVIGGGLWDNGRVGQWVDQQDTGRNGGRVPWVLEDGGEEDGRLGDGDVGSWAGGCQERKVGMDKFPREFGAVGDGGDKGRIVIPKGQGGTGLGGRRVIMGPSLRGRPKEVFDGLASSLDVELVDVVKVGPGGGRGSGRRRHF